MTLPVRILDHGVDEGRLQIARDAALIDLHRAGRTPDTIRFLRFPPTVLIGRHQALAREVNLAVVRARGLGLVRRITGGGAIYLDEGQVGWELLVSRRRLPRASLADYARDISEAVAHGLSQAFGIDARFRPRNDIEVAGRKISGTGGFFDGDTLIYQGTVLIDMDRGRMAEALNVPDAKLAKRALASAGDRIVTLRELCGPGPDVPAVHRAILSGFEEKLGLLGAPAPPTAEEEALAARYFAEEIGTDAFVHEIDDPAGAGILEASHTSPGGTASAHVRLEGDGPVRRIREVRLTGDFFVTPPRLILDLEAALRGVLVPDVGPAVDRFFAINPAQMLSLSPADLRGVIEAAIAAKG